MADQPEVVKTYSIQYVVGALIVGLIVGVLLSSFWTGTGKEKPAIVSTQPTNATSSEEKDASVKVSTETSKTATAMLLINDQPAGLSVVVAKADIEEDNWVVIHEDRMGIPGNALGAARFIGGATSGTIELLRGTTPSQTYHGLLYKDDGDHVFSMERDVPLRDENGNPIQVTFKTN